MKYFFNIFGIIVCIFTINSCAILHSVNLMKGESKIDESVLSIENENFQQEVGLDLKVLKRRLFSIENGYRNRMITFYFDSFLNNHLVLSFDNEKNEFVQQQTSNDRINIVFNSQLQNYSEYEKEVLICVSIATLALLRDDNFNRNRFPKIFFDLIGVYERSKMPNIRNAEWFKKKNITIANDGITIID